MKKAAALAAAAVLSAAVLPGCSSNNKSSMSASTDSSSSQVQPDLIDPNTDPTAGRLDGVEAAADGPKLTVSNTTAKAGETASVTISVKDADLKWNACGLHITYPNVLQIEMFDEEARYPRNKKGDAVDYATGTVAMVWKDNLPEELVKNELLSVFFTAIFDGNNGLDGDIVTYFFDIPEDAESGTVYPIDFYFLETDMFTNAEDDVSFEKYAFTNWVGGSITVE